MTTKTYSQLQKTNVLQDADLIAIERNGIATFSINAKDFKNSIRSDLLQDTQTPATHNIVFMDCEHINGIPTNYPKTLVYLDGSTKYRNDLNENYGKFIDNIKDNAYYRQKYNVPADNSSFSVVDARNYTFRSAGNLLPIGTKQEDGIQKLELLNQGKVNLNYTLQATASATSVSGLSSFTNYNGNGIITALGSATTQQGNFPSVLNLTCIKSIDIDFEKVLIQKNPLLRQNEVETTIKSIGTFAFLDISLGALAVVNMLNAGGGVDSVNGKSGVVILTANDVELSNPLKANATIQGALEYLEADKVSSTQLTGYATTQDLTNGLSGKANISHTHIINDITGLQDALNLKQDKDGLITDLKYNANITLLAKLTSQDDLINTKANTSELANYLKKDGSITLNTGYSPGNALSIATKGYVDGLIPDLSNYLQLGGEYITAGVGLKFKADIGAELTTIEGQGLNIVSGTRKADINNNSLSFYDTATGGLSNIKFSINTFVGKLNYYETTIVSSVWDMKQRQITDNVLTANLLDNSIILKKDLFTYLNRYQAFGIKYLKTGLTTTINSNATALTNLSNIVKVSPTITTWARDNKGDDKAGISFIDVTNGWKFPVVDGLTNYGIGVTITITGTITGTAGTPRELIVYLRRLSDNSLIRNGGIIKINDNNFNGRSTNIETFIKGATDPFITGGFYLDMLNNSGGNLTLSALEIYIKSV